MTRKYDPFEDLDRVANRAKREKRERWVIPGPTGYVLAVFYIPETGEYRAYQKRNLGGNKWASYSLTGAQYRAIQGSADPLTLLRKGRE